QQNAGGSLRSLGPQLDGEDALPRSLIGLPLEQDAAHLRLLVPATPPPVLLGLVQRAGAARQLGGRRRPREQAGQHQGEPRKGEEASLEAMASSGRPLHVPPGWKLPPSQ